MSSRGGKAKPTSVRSPTTVDALHLHAAGKSFDADAQSFDADAQLRAFDHDLKLGPSVGITRLERWERARNFGLEPPENIPDLLRHAAAEDQKSVFEHLMYKDAR